MCGIWGFITGEKGRGSAGRLRFVENAAIAGTLRGADSTGAIIVPHKHDGAADWCKVVGTGQDWLESKYTQEKFTLARASDMRAVVGHNRSATLGKVTLDNAHPFQEGPVTLVHNGTLDDMSDMKVQADAVGSKKKPVEVDSHLICHNLVEHPPEIVLPTLYGAFALVWHDGRTDSVYMVRNSQRPLHMMRAKCEDTILFASEPDMLWWLAGRCNFVRGDIYSLDPGTLLEFKAGETKPHAKKITLGWKTTRYTGYTYGGGSGSSSTSGASKSSGKAAPSETAPAPSGGTSKRGRAMLTLLGFEPRQELEFSVENVLKAGATCATVNGWAYFQNDQGKTEAIQAIVHGLDHRYAQSKSRDDWFVRPVAVWKVGEKGKEQPSLICRLVRVSPAYSASQQTERKCAGPFGNLIEVKEWLRLTTGGCCECARALTVSEAGAIVWTSNHTLPLCPDCATRWTDSLDDDGAPVLALMN